jgi:hypothetical protein
MALLHWRFDLAEVLKNAVRAVMERTTAPPLRWKPEISIRVCAGDAMSIVFGHQRDTK